MYVPQGASTGFRHASTQAPTAADDQAAEDDLGDVPQGGLGDGQKEEAAMGEETAGGDDGDEFVAATPPSPGTQSKRRRL